MTAHRTHTRAGAHSARPRARQGHRILPIRRPRRGSARDLNEPRQVLMLDQSPQEDAPAERPIHPTDGRIVGIGASAGGLEALEQLFDALPADTGMAFVVVQHLSPDFRSLMDELISRHSEMPVVIADDNMPVLANHIYVMPPRKQMIIRDRHLVLTDKEPQAFTLPIDTFFRSLAQDVGDQAVAIVLSGSGSDGSRGVVEIRRVGGLVLAETAASAKFDS